MSREDFKSFVETIEHNIFLKEKLLKCRGSNDLILLAKKYRYSITVDDLNYDKTITQFGIWFKESRISPLKQPN
tara:strand:- start:1526 stop:1747 length:222 start_codon:yes stop_codon:yes gene_type:complete